MLSITVPEGELFDASTNSFISLKRQVLQLEHSLVSVSKWESKWNKPFLSKDAKTHEESVDYIRCMTITQNVDPNVYIRINDELIDKISEYIEAPMTATSINEINSQRGKKEVITSEVIYYWMISFNIPFECQKWHLNRLLTLIRVCNIKNAPPKKMSKRDILNRNRELNAARRKELNTKG